ncbi:hypothetical protein D3C80_1501990 [compost metagenome]
MDSRLSTNKKAAIRFTPGRALINNKPYTNNRPIDPESERFWAEFNETIYKFTPGLNIINEGKKIVTGTNLEGQSFAPLSALEAAGPL